MSNPSAEQRLKGALGAIERRARVGATLFNEFNDRPLVEFKSQRTVLPRHTGSDSMETLLEIRLGSSYAIFRGDDDEVIERAERTAMRALCRCLYQDVLDDLLTITKVVGDGNRRQAMELLNDLYMRLDGRE